MDAYCVRCRNKVEIMDMVIHQSDSGRRIAKGTCSNGCGNAVQRLLGSQLLVKEPKGKVGRSDEVVRLGVVHDDPGRAVTYRDKLRAYKALIFGKIAG